jgi:hypothetical protein
MCPSTIPSSAKGTNNGHALLTTLISGIIECNALTYAFDLIVASVPYTPILLFFSI